MRYGAGLSDNWALVSVNEGFSEPYLTVRLWVSVRWLLQGGGLGMGRLGDECVWHGRRVAGVALWVGAGLRRRCQELVLGVLHKF